MEQAVPANPKKELLGIDYQYLFSEWKQMFASESTVVKDIWAGATVALVALPLNLALAIGAGVEPSVGITTGIIAGIVGSLFGGQRLAVTGPAAAMAVVLVEISQTYGIGGIWMVCLVAGALQLLAGMFKLGRLISFIPMPVTVGFATAIGSLVFFNALDDFLGLPSKRIAHVGEMPVPAHNLLPQFLVDLSDIWHRCVVHQEMNWQAIMLGVLALLIAYFLPRLTRAIPGQLVAIVVTTMLATFLHLNVPVIKDVATISNLMPGPAWPQLPWQDFFILFPTAITVFMLGSIESLLSASVADGMTGSSKHHSNQELVGQGIANMVVPFFGGIPVTGVIARTAVNIRAGARTRLAGVIHSLVLMTLIFLFAKQAEQIPLAALAAILMLTGIRLIEWDAVREIWRVSRPEGYVVIATTIAAVAVNLTAGVFVGLVFACALFIRQMSDVNLTPSAADNEMVIDIPTCNYVRTYVVDGPLFFGAAERFIENIIVLDTVKVIILHMKAARVMDLTGVETLLSIQHQLRRHGGKLVLAELPAQPLALLDKTSALETIGKNNVFSDYKTAVLTVNNDLLSSNCKSCAIKEGKGPKDCRLRNALLDESSPMARMLETLKATPTRSDEAGLEWLFPVDSPGEIPKMLQNTPIETLLLGQNLGEIQVRPSNMAEIVIGMCIDFRKSLSIPRDWAFILRREGANMDGAEFAIALALSKGVRHMALIAHNSCAMSNTADHRDAFVTVLSQKYNWNREQALDFFDNHARSHDIGNEIDFVLQEANRLSALFPGLMVVPILFRVEDDRLYLIYDWLIANAKDDSIMRKLKLRDTGGFRPISN